MGSNFQNVSLLESDFNLRRNATANASALLVSFQTALLNDSWKEVPGFLEISCNPNGSWSSHPAFRAMRLRRVEETDEIPGDVSALGRGSRCSGGRNRPVASRGDKGGLNEFSISSRSLCQLLNLMKLLATHSHAFVLLLCVVSVS